ncbi:hypothetical protein M0638_14275 [Roseomonas sp. NAR14]|uniref:Uncharacterized protein n=1 Tax=Roseomonas acroporae TaxID=2937791 RepID=A0A9X1YG16_9PROT|nr:hypothetical protein [Roseomonas acroporae]MCK8785551.1 hypothetical protein [Roseomonas acroporae]
MRFGGGRVHALRVGGVALAVTGLPMTLWGRYGEPPQPLLVGLGQACSLLGLGCLLAYLALRRRLRE